MEETTTARGVARAREGAGWRAGRPVEDPYKTKSWGWVTAKPSEYLVHCRRGRVLSSSSGQGATCFKWPWDSVAIVPTSFQRLSFTADQVSLEKVGIQVTGLAVYRIADPLIAYRILNFSFPERAQEKLEHTLTAMLVGATRRLVANLAVDDCIRKRKQGLAAELLEEIAPVVGGEGRPEDGTDRGWGVVIDTIEIQEVRVLSAQVFDAMQAPFRAALDREAREARAEAAKKSALAEAGSRREVEESRLGADAAVEARRVEIAREQAEGRTRDAIQARELAAEEARAEVVAHETRVAALTARAERERVERGIALEHRRAEADLDVEIRAAVAEVALAEARAERQRAEARARVLVAENLPALAQAVGQKFGEVRVTQIGTDGSPFGSIAQAVASVLELVREGAPTSS